MEKYFDKIYCINLNRREDRWNETLEELKKWGLSDSVSRYSAIDGNTLNNDTVINNGELGILTTHINIITEAKENNYNNILILEDDIEFTKEIENIDEYKRLYDEYPKIIIENGLIFINSHSLTKCKEIEEVLRSNLIILDSTLDKVYLDSDEICFLNNWDAEKYRKLL